MTDLPPLDLLPNAVRLVTDFLVADPDCHALIGTRAYGRLPSNDKKWPIVRITRIGGSPPDEDPHWIDRPLLQADCMATTKAPAWKLAETCRAAVKQRIKGTHIVGDSPAVVNSVTVGGIAENVDETFDPLIHVARFDIVLTTHPG